MMKTPQQLSALSGLETQVHELQYLSVLWSRMENEIVGEHMPDGTFVVRRDPEDVNIHAFLGYEIARRSASLRRDYLACFDAGAADV